MWFLMARWGWEYRNIRRDRNVRPTNPQIIFAPGGLTNAGFYLPRNLLLIPSGHAGSVANDRRYEARSSSPCSVGQFMCQQPQTLHRVFLLANTQHDRIVESDCICAGT